MKKIYLVIISILVILNFNLCAQVQIVEMIEHGSQTVNKLYTSQHKADSLFYSLFNIVYQNFDTLNVETISKFELNSKSKIVNFNYGIRLGKDIYPNKNNFKIEQPLSFTRLEDSSFNLVSYYYHTSDKSIKIATFDWNINNELDLNKNQLFSNFKIKYNKLNEIITIVTESKPIESKLDSKCISEWKLKDGKIIKLLLFEISNGYREIRLYIYKK